MRKTIWRKLASAVAVAAALALAMGAGAALADELEAAAVDEQPLVAELEQPEGELEEPAAVFGWEKQDDGRWVYHEGDALATGLHLCGDEGWYVFDAQGYLVTGKTGWYLDTTTSQWVYLTDGKGRAQMSGWLKVGGKWYYFVDGYMVADTVLTVDDMLYHFGKSGSLGAGWYDMDGNWVYFGDNGKQLMQGWVSSGGKWYYIGHDYASGADGVMVTNACVLTGEHFYFVDDSGVMRTGWLHVQMFDQGRRYVETAADEPGRWMWADASGRLFMDGWKQVGGKWYFFEEFAMYTGKLFYLGDLYYLRDNGTMATGWVDLGGWYYFNSKGRAVTGWQQIGSAWYYFDYGVMASDYLLTDAKGRLYYLKANGAMAVNMVFEYDGVVYRADGSGLVRPIR